jgi:hypothetical protein
LQSTEKQINMEKENSGALNIFVFLVHPSIYSYFDLVILIQEPE